MKTSVSYNLWLKTAYRLFAEKGPENFSVNDLAKECQLPRTNFYYYFDNKEDLIDRIIEFHFQTTTEIFNKELESRLHHFIPDLYLIVCDFKIGVQFTKQLFNNRENPIFDKAYRQTSSLSADLIIPIFLDYTKIELPNHLAKSLWFILTDSWYSRICFKNFNIESLVELYEELTAPFIHLTKK